MGMEQMEQLGLPLEEPRIGEQPPKEAGPESEEGRRIEKALRALKDNKIFTEEQAEALSCLEGLNTPQEVVFVWPGDPFKPKGIAVVEWNDQGRLVTAALYDESLYNKKKEKGHGNPDEKGYN